MFLTRVVHKKGVFCGESWLKWGVVHKKGVFCGGNRFGNISVVARQGAIVIKERDQSGGSCYLLKAVHAI